MGSNVGTSDSCLFLAVVRIQLAVGAGVLTARFLRPRPAPAKIPSGLCVCRHSTQLAVGDLEGGQ